MRMDYAIGFLMRPLYAQITHLQKTRKEGGASEDQGRVIRP